MKKAALTVLSVSAIAGCVWLFAPNPQQHQAEQAVSRIEAFKRMNHRLPKSLSETGMEEPESCPCYRAEDDRAHIVWYGKPLTLGESFTYDSRSQKWSD
jgi:hypothetical protein